MKQQLQALENKIKDTAKNIGKKVVNKLQEATLSEQELKEKNNVVPTKTNDQKLKDAQDATTIQPRSAPTVMQVGRKIIK